MPPSRPDIADTESDTLSSILDDLLSESRLSTIPASNATQSTFDEPSSFINTSSSAIRPRSVTSNVWQYGHKKVVDGITKRHGKNAIWECDDCRKELSNTGAAKQYLWYIYKSSVDEYTGEASQPAKKRKMMRVEDPRSIEAGFARPEPVSAELRVRQNKQFLYDVIN